ncbi:MAG TPA: type 1 glutamine amidotransferase domain-containing protein [Terriglobales bacterium]|jgi:protease I
MAEATLNGFRVAILATNGVEQSELTEPRKALDEAGAHTTLLALKPGKIQAMEHDEKSEQFTVDARLDQASPDEFDAVLLPGGALNADALRMEKSAREFVKKIDQAGKPIAAICHAPWLLISAGLVKGRKLTSYHTIQDDLRNAGAEWADQSVVHDGNWVSSRQPSDIPAFNREMIRLFGETQKVRKAA